VDEKSKYFAQNSLKDTIFKTPYRKKFSFDKRVAAVFDDMVSRSVPLYKETIEFIKNLINYFGKEGDIVIDIGCSTANLLIEIAKLNKNFRLIGVDTSSAMIEQAKNKVLALGKEIELKKMDLFELKERANFIVANYTLQFIEPKKRKDAIKHIFNLLEKNGIFIFSEKIVYKDKKLNDFITKNYFEFKKKNGYSEYEIAQKREALENVLVPLTEKENKRMLKSVGFEKIETILKWGNFETIIGIK